MLTLCGPEPADDMRVHELEALLDATPHSGASPYVYPEHMYCDSISSQWVKRQWAPTDEDGGGHWVVIDRYSDTTGTQVRSDLLVPLAGLLLGARELLIVFNASHWRWNGRATLSCNGKLAVRFKTPLRCGVRLRPSLDESVAAA